MCDDVCQCKFAEKLFGGIVAISVFQLKFFVSVGVDYSVLTGSTQNMHSNN